MRSSSKAGHHQERFWSYFLRGVLIVFLATLLAFLLHRAGLLDRLESASLDMWILQKKPVSSQHLLLVTINAADYENPLLFDGQSPLKQREVITIINAIAAAKPSVIGVDLDTSTWNPDLNETISKGAPIVWVREARLSEAEAKDLQWPDSNVKLKKLLGGDDGKGNCWGLPALAPDADGVLRRYLTEIPEEGLSDKAGTTPRTAFVSFIDVIDEVSRKASCPTPTRPISTKTSEEDLRPLIDFVRWKLPRYSGSAILDLARVPDWRDHPEKYPEINKKIVLLGGAFEESRDYYRTPVGWRYGVEILGSALETTLNGGLRIASDLRLAVVDFLVGLVLVCLAYRFNKLWMLPFELVLIPLAAILLSVLLFNTARYFVSFFPILLGVALHEIVEHGFEYRDLLKQNRDLEARLGELERAPAKQNDTSE